MSEDPQETHVEADLLRSLVNPNRAALLNNWAADQSWSAAEFAVAAALVVGRDFSLIKCEGCRDALLTQFFVILQSMAESRGPLQVAHEGTLQ